MRIMWIVNPLLKIAGEMVNGKRQGGLWMDAMLGDFEKNDDIQLSVVTCSPVKEMLVGKENGVSYYVLPSQYPINYNENNKKNIQAWKQLLEKLKPDVIQVWGTEFSHGLCALRIAKQMGIPSIIYMQGYLGSIYRYYLAGISKGQIKRNLTFRDIIKRDSILQQMVRYKKRHQKEKEMIALAGNVVVENDWCENCILSVVPQANIFRLPLSINKVFSQYNWTKEGMNRHSIITNASGYPLKGLHNVLRAVHILKERYADIKLYVPGEKVVSNHNIKSLLRRRGYSKYIEKLIKKLNLQDNIVWLGNVSQEELAINYTKSNVFVLGSSIENHSSSLKEAMIVGVPSVASSVGGVPEYVSHGKNGFLYRYEEFEVMAIQIEKIFEDDSLAELISTNAKTSMKALHNGVKEYQLIMDMYSKIV